MSSDGSCRSRVLLSPALAPLHRAVRRACASQTLNPRGAEFEETYLAIEARLQELLGTTQDVLLAGGNGTQAMELAVANTVNVGARVLVVSQGAFGDRFADVLRVYGAEVHVLRGGLATAITPQQIDRALSRAGPVHACFLVHVETSVGVRSELAELAAAVRRRAAGALVVVDAMTSLGAHEIRFDAWGLDVLVSAGHKALGAPPGMAIIALSERAWRACARAETPRFCGDLCQMRRFHRRGQSRHLLPVQPFLGLHAALRLISTTGLAVFRRHLETLAQRARSRLGELGLRLVAPRTQAARSVTCAWLPPAVSATALVRLLSDQCGVEVAAGRDRWSDRMIRIGHLGLAATVADLETGLDALAACLSTYREGLKDFRRLRGRTGTPARRAVGTAKSDRPTVEYSPALRLAGDLP